MANPRELQTQISTLRNMQKVMHAMSTIATIKLRKFYRFQASLSLFDRCLGAIAADINNALRDAPYTPVSGYKNVSKVHVIVFTADKGLCGSHNSAVYKALKQLVNANNKNNIAFDISCIGTQGAHYCKRQQHEVYHQTEISERTLTNEALMHFSAKILKRFFDNEIQEIYLVANYFISTLEHDTKTIRLIPITPAISKNKEAIVKVDTEIEPEPRKFIIQAAGFYLYYTLLSAWCNSSLSEQSSRMIAMENATNNSEGLISHYVALRNRARQADITNELIEIISGKEALKG